MPMDIAALRTRFNQVCQKNENAISEIHHSHNLNPDMPDRLHHYTNIEGLHGIIRSGEVWATSVEYLNDSVEISYGLDLAKDALAKAREENAGHENLVIRCQLHRIMHELDRHRFNKSYFVTCFCEAPDLLSQWRAYGKNAGYSLDLRAKRFYESVRSHVENVPTDGYTKSERATYMERVIYDPTVQRALVSKVMKSCIDAYRELAADEDFLAEEMRTSPDKDFDELTDRFAKYAAGKALRFVSQFKHPAFEEEQEWRLVHRRNALDHGDAEFRIGNGCLIPYTKFRFDLDECLESITCGPPSLPLSMNSIERFIRASGLKDKPLLSSKAPLRL